jgi:hypothetical protein
MTRVFFLATLLLLSAQAAQSQTTSTCLPADSDAVEFRSNVRELVTAVDPDRIAIRNQLGLKAMDSTRVVFVTDNTTCNKVASGLNTAFETPGLVRQLYVVAVGTMFAAADPGHPMGEWLGTSSLDNKFKFKATVLSP